MACLNFTGRIALGVLLCSLGACAADTRDTPFTTDGNPVTGDGAAPNPPGTDNSGTNSPPLVEAPDIEECAEVQATGNVERSPVDIVWVVDASPSMVDEQQRIQENLERFANNFTAAGINANVVIITEDDIGSCTTLANTSQYLFVPADVDSSNSLVVLLDTYPQYAGHLRPEAVTHFIAVTDDESELAAAQFRNQMESNLGGEFVLHAIASENAGGGGGGFGGFGGFGGACMPDVCPDTSSITGACGGNLGGFGGFGGFGGAFCGATRPGEIYYDLADQTGGLKISICEEDWTMVFDQLGTAVIASSALPCAFDLPPAPPGASLDPEKVRVDFTPTGATPLQFPRAVTQAACADHDAWHYSADGAQIVLCDAACSTVEVGGAINITLGCAPTVVIQ